MARTSTRDEILRVAAAHFSSAGFKGTSLQDIAAEVGCSKATLLYHFAGKEQILLAVAHQAERAFADLVAELEALPDDRVRAAAVEGFIDLVLRYRREAALVYDVMPQFRQTPAFGEVVRQAEVLCAALAGRSEHPADAIAALTVLHGIVSVAISDDWDPADVRPALLRVARRALIPPYAHDKD